MSVLPQCIWETDPNGRRRQYFIEETPPPRDGSQIPTFYTKGLWHGEHNLAPPVLAPAWRTARAVVQRSRTPPFALDCDAHTEPPTPILSSLTPREHCTTGLGELPNLFASPRTPRKKSAAVPGLLCESYDETKKKYGWQLQLQGDPYGLKQPLLPTRQSYAGHVDTGPAHAVLPQNVKRVGGGENLFFYNTIPPLKYTFTVSTDFASEGIVEQRKKRQASPSYKFIAPTSSFLY